MTWLWFLAAALAEIGGCFAFWLWLRSEHSGWWLVPGIASLALFAFFLTRAEVQFAGRAFAAYGGVLDRQFVGLAPLGRRRAPDRHGCTGRTALPGRRRCNSLRLALRRMIGANQPGFTARSTEMMHEIYPGG